MNWQSLLNCYDTVYNIYRQGINIPEKYVERSSVLLTQRWFFETHEMYVNIDNLRMAVSLRLHFIYPEPMYSMMTYNKFRKLIS